MGFFGDFVKQGVGEMCIARPNEQKHLIMYRHPDQTIPWKAFCTVQQDEGVVFFKDGVWQGTLGPGRYNLDTQNIPFLSNFVDKFTGGNLFRAEVYFVLSRPVRELKFGGKLDSVVDPLTHVRCNPRIFGEYAMQIIDPVKFIVGYRGMGTPTEDNDAVMRWVSDDKLMVEIEQIIADVCMEEGVSLTRIGGKKRALAKRFMDGVPALDDIGVRVTEFGRFKITLDEKDQQKIDKIFDAMHSDQIMAEAEAKKAEYKLAQEFKYKAQYANLAGQNPGYMAAAQADAMRGAGEGMAKGGEGGAGVAGLGAQMAVGVGMAGMFNQGFQQPQPQYQRAQAPAGGQITCSKCNMGNAGGKFCANCGNPLAPPAPAAQPGGFCSNCGQPVAGKFCASCGTPFSGGAPAGGAPPQGAPPQGAPPQGAPPQGAPQQGAPQQGYPQAPQGVPPGQGGQGGQGA